MSLCWNKKVVKSVSYLGGEALAVASGTGSLTRSLQESVGQVIEFSCLEHKVTPLSPSDAHYLGRKSGEACVCRSILWSYQVHDWVYAETTMLMDSYHWLFERHDRERPIGDLLFGDASKNIVASPLEFVMIDNNSDLHRRVKEHVSLPVIGYSLLARRRQFMVNQRYPLMIVEVFLPAMRDSFKALKNKRG